MKTTRLLCASLLVLGIATEALAQRGERRSDTRSGGSDRGSSSSSSSSRSDRGSVSSSSGPASRDRSSSSSSRPSSSSTSSSSSSTSSRPRTTVSSSSGPAPRRDTTPTHTTPTTRQPDPTPRERGPVSSERGPAPRPEVKVPQHEQGRVITGRTTHRHAPQVAKPAVVRHELPRNYHRVIARNHIYRRWVLLPVHFRYTPGYWYEDNYPWYVHNGYRHRYDPIDMCEYELVDGNNYQVISKTGLLSCKQAYDMCSALRDERNSQVGMERFFCAEAVDDDLNVNESEYSPVPETMDETKKAAIAAYLAGKSTRDIWEDGWYNNVGNCAVVKLRGNPHGCRWLVKVNGLVYPDPNGSVCSEPLRAGLIDCREGGEKDNAGCILKKAVLEGHCH